MIDILRNPIYAGVYRWNYRRSGRGDRKPDEEVVTVDQAVPAIISREQWERVQRLLDANYKGRRDRQRRARHPHILSGLIRCAYCGQTYLATRSTRPYRGGYHPSIYRCGTYVRNMQCRNKSLTGTHIEPFVLEYLRAYVVAAHAKKGSLGEEILKAFGRPEIEHVEIENAGAGLAGVLGGMAEVAAGSKKEAAADEKLEALKGQKQRIERAIARLDDAYFFAEEGPNAISKAEYLVKRADLIEKLKKIDGEIAALGKERPAAGALDVELLSRFLLVHNLYVAGSIREVLPHLDPLVMQGFLQQVIRYVEVADGKVTRIVFNGPGGEITHRFVYRESS